MQEAGGVEFARSPQLLEKMLFGEIDLMKYDCRFERGNRRFQLRAGAIIIEDGCVLLAKTDEADYYYNVGGGVHIGETAEEAVKREVFEETGVHYEVDRLVFVQENFFVDEVISKGMEFHEIALHFLMKPMGKREITKESFGCAGKEYMNWIPLEDLKKYTVFPEFFADELINLPEGVKHIVTNELE